MRIGIAFDLAPAEPPDGREGPDDRFEEFDRPETIDAIADVLRSEGHEVALLGDGPALLRSLLDQPPDFVWNLAEGQGTSRSREARVPAVLEMLGIPHSGSDPLTLAATLDKPVAKTLVAAAGVAVPWGAVYAPEASPHQVERELAAQFARQAAEGAGVPPTLIVKPALEGSSKGIRGRCLAHSPDEAAATFHRLARAYGQPVLVESFIEGDEVTVGLVGNGPGARVLGTMRVVPRRPTDRFVYSLEVKRDWQNRVTYETPAGLPQPVHERLCAAALRAYAALGCRDLARIDFRIYRLENEPYFIEANPLPGLAPVTSDLVILARGYGLEYAELIRTILSTALVRVGLVQPEPVAP